MRQLKITKSITNRESASLDKYLQEIGREDLITVEEEVELAQRIKKGDHAALEKLTRANLRFVVSVAKQYQNQGLSPRSAVPLPTAPTSAIPPSSSTMSPPPSRKKPPRPLPAAAFRSKWPRPRPACVSVWRKPFPGRLITTSPSTPMPAPPPPGRALPAARRSWPMASPAASAGAPAK